MIHVAVVRTGYIFISAHTYATTQFFYAQEHGSSTSLSGEKSQWNFTVASIHLQLHKNELSCSLHLLQLCTEQADSKHDIEVLTAVLLKMQLTGTWQFQKGEWKECSAFIFRVKQSKKMFCLECLTLTSKALWSFQISELLVKQHSITSQKTCNFLYTKCYRLLSVILTWPCKAVTPYLDSVQQLLWVIFSSVESHLYQIHQPERITKSQNYVCTSRSHITSSIGEILSSCIHHLPQQPVPSDPPSS